MRFEDFYKLYEEDLKPKKKTFMEQLYLRNQARAMAEEIVINEIVFKCR